MQFRRFQGRRVVVVAAIATTLATIIGVQSAAFAGSRFAMSTASPAAKGAPARTSATTGHLPATRTSRALADPHMDFDGDGLDDLVAYSGDVSEHRCLYVDYSSGIPANCPTPVPNEAGQPDNAYWASDDFNGDGFDDLALGESDRATLGSGRDYAGRVEVYYGGTAGLGSMFQMFTQDTAGIAGTSGPHHYFGQTLAAGDLNGDGYADLAIAVPGDTVVGHPDAGSVVAVLGSAEGLRAVGSIRFAANHPGVPGPVQTANWFGSAVAIVDVTGDGLADLAVSNQEELDPRLSLFKGSRASGLSFTGVTTIRINRTDSFMIDLMAGGDFNGDGYGDVIAGNPSIVPGGTIGEFLGGPEGIGIGRVHVFRQGLAGVAGLDETSDFWGSMLTVGDLTGDGKDDVLVGNPSENVGQVTAAGAFTLIRGARTGLTGQRSQMWNQSMPNICGKVTSRNLFSVALTIGRFTVENRLDAYIAAPLDSTSQPSSGLLQALIGGPSPQPGACIYGSRYSGLGFDLVGARN